jgi:hypothetical protein
MGTVRKPCPQCDRGPRDKALAVTTDDRGVVAYCHRCGYVEVENQGGRPPKFSPRTVAKSDPLDWSTKAEAIWNRTQALRDTLGERYLQHRGCAKSAQRRAMRRTTNERRT